MKHEKILFEHENTPEGEYGIESAWATPVGVNYQLDNILFYALEYSWGDIVSVESKHGELFVTGLVEETGHSTVRIIFNQVNDVEATRNQLKALGCDSEISDVKFLIAVDIPPQVPYCNIRLYLDEGEASGKWSYEEACIAHKD